MELSDNTKNALVQLLAQSINTGLQQGLIIHTNKDRNDATASPAEWNARTGGDRKQLCTAITCSASAAGSNLIIQVWLGYDVRPYNANNTASIASDAMQAGVDDTGSNGPYSVVFRSGITPTVSYFALEPDGSEPTTSGSQAPKYPIYNTDISPFPIQAAGAIVT